MYLEDGIKIISQSEIMEYSNVYIGIARLFFAMFFLVVLLYVIVPISHLIYCKIRNRECRFERWFKYFDCSLVITGVSFVAIIAFGGTFPEHLSTVHTNTYEYTCEIDDSVRYNELTSKYEVISIDDNTGYVTLELKNKK